MGTYQIRSSSKYHEAFPVPLHSSPRGGKLLTVVGHGDIDQPGADNAEG